MERDPHLRAPAVDTRRETGDPLKDGYVTLNRARQGWDGRYEMPSYTKPDLPVMSYGDEGPEIEYEDDD